MVVPKLEKCIAFSTCVITEKHCASGVKVQGFLMIRDYFHTAWITGIFMVNYHSAEVIDMDLFWSGLAKRASEHTRVERRSQFSKVFEQVIQEIELQRDTN